MNSRGAWRGQSKHVVLTVMNNHLIQPSSLSLELLEPPGYPPASLHLCLTHGRAIRPNSRSEVCSSVNTEDREGLCLWKLLRTEVNHHGAEDAPQITPWQRVWPGSPREQTSMQAHERSHTETREPRCYTKI